MIFSLTRKLPKPIRNILQRVYNLWMLRVVPDERIVGEVAEYYELSRKETRRLMGSGRQLNANLWRAFHPKNDQEKNEFYEFTPFYIFELLYWHMQRDQRSFRSAIIEASRGEVLDFGGGPGDLTAELAGEGLSVTYADVQGKTFDFARWLFQKRGLAVKTINLSKEQLEGGYDTIICIDVIEHVPDAKATLQMLLSHLNPGGSLMITNLHIDTVPETHPMHSKVDFGAAEHLTVQGLKQKSSWLREKSS
ncbi:MAG: class I SAM-dependent methyltransferase [Candidatus Pacearchaeota archaeon]|nr:class I SAM-dependent methyltransferase [Candidatus Pacearchaeota archaeon]